jgi:hypothetical protein
MTVAQVESSPLSSGLEGNPRWFGRPASVTCVNTSPKSLARGPSEEASMDDNIFNMSVRKFLKTLGVTAQREIENAVREALSSGRLTGKEKLPAKAILTLGQINLNLVVDGEIELG